MKRDEEGLTLIEVLVALFVFSTVSVGFYQLMFATRTGSQGARDVAAVSEEARLGFNRLVRDTREASAVKSATATSFTIWTDFDNDNAEDAAPADLTGSHEVVTYSWNSVAKTISITSGTTTEVLMEGVDCVERTGTPPSCTQPVFTYASSRLEYDANGDGLATAEELDSNPSIGNGDYATNPFPNGVEQNFVDLVTFSFKVTQGDGSATFYSDAQLRNRR